MGVRVVQVSLSLVNAAAADEALARVRDAERAATAAVAGRSSVLVWLTGSSSSASAQDENLRQTSKIRAQLEGMRPDLTDAGVPGFLELAAVGANVSDIIEDARRQSGAGFQEEVIAPTVAEAKAAATVGAFGLASVGILALVVWGLMYLPRRGAR